MFCDVYFYSKFSLRHYSLPKTRWLSVYKERKALQPREDLSVNIAAALNRIFRAAKHDRRSRLLARGELRFGGSSEANERGTARNLQGDAE